MNKLVEAAMVGIEEAKKSTEYQTRASLLRTIVEQINNQLSELPLRNASVCIVGLPLKPNRALQLIVKNKLKWVVTLAEIKVDLNLSLPCRFSYWQSNTTLCDLSEFEGIVMEVLKGPRAGGAILELEGNMDPPADADLPKQ